ATNYTDAVAATLRAKSDLAYRNAAHNGIEKWVVTIQGETATLTVEGPLGGQSSAEFEPIVSLPAEDSYESYGASWCDASGNFLEDEVIFEAGQTYYMNVGLRAIEGAWFVQGQEGTTLIVHGGNKASDLVIENETEEDGTIYSNANAIVAVKSTAAVDGLIQKLSLDFTKPEPGTKVSQAKDGAPTPALDLRIPEGVSYSFAWPEAARYAEGWGNPTTFNNFVLEDGVGLNAITILKTDAPNSFYAHALVSIEDAEVKNVELLDSTTLKVTFAFQVGGEPRDTVSVLLCDTEQNLNTGGTVKSLYYGAGEEPDLENAEENDICFERSGMPGGILRLEAVPKEGYDFAGWFTGYADRPWSDEGACYDPDSLISAETVISYDFKETGMNCYCAVFKLSGTPEGVHAKKVSLSKSSAKVLVGKTLKLKATVTPAKAVDGAITWKSGNTKIATVSRDGLVTAKAPGTVTIRAMTANGVKATCKVTVTFRYVYECEKNGYYRYTTNKTIVKELRNQGWSYRKAFRAPGVSDTKVYWIYNKTTKRYRYTTNLTYAKQQKAAGNKAGFAFYQAASKTVPVYELAKGTKTVTYYYTMKRATAREMQKQGWRYEGIAWYAQPKTA
ncbi:MAG: Ig-like domain-containing protein, partial [Lachnospiraceae bacterium]